jgi:sodium transport system permease protein
MNGILVPVFMYPIMMWVMITGLMFVMGQMDRESSRLVILDPPAEHSALIDTLGAQTNLEIREDVTSEDSAMVLLRAGDLDALVEFLPATDQASVLEDNFQALIRYDRAVGRSSQASARVESTIADYRSEWLTQQASALGIPETEREQFRIVQDNVSTEEEIGTLLMGMMIPMFLVLMIAMGCLMPAIDSTAGERERSTWETLMTVSASRLSVVTSKYFYVATLGILAGVLNVVAMFASMGVIMGPLLVDLGESANAFQFSLSPLALPVMIVAAIALALFFAAVMMILAAFARTFKDGQAMVTPVMFLAMAPLFLGQQTDQTLTPVVAAIPVANAAMMIRDAINGVFLWPLIAETLAVLLAMVTACLLIARVLLKTEDFLLLSPRWEVLEI